jgi:hypothetical protein
MTWRSFLFATQALMAEEGLSFHVETPDSSAPSPADTKQQNAQSMAALAGILGGVQGAPRGARR